MLRYWRIAVTLALALTGLSTVALACGGGGEGSAEDRQEVEDTVRTLAGYGAEDVDAFLEGVTDNVLENFFGFTREECKDNAQQCVVDPSESPSLANTKVSGDTATTEGTFSFDGDEETFLLSLVRVDGKWKLDALKNVPKEIPGGVKKVDLELNEFAFGFNASETTDGNFAFVAKNIGKQNHQVVVFKVLEGVDLKEALQSEEEVPGFAEIAFAGPFPPDDEGTVVFDQPLQPGRYGLACFIADREDPDRTPHAFKGMIAEFTID